MKISYKLPLIATVFALILSACSQLDTRESITLSTQLGPRFTNSSAGVATNQAGHIYALTRLSYSEPLNPNEFFPFVSNEEGTLSRYDRNGKLLWEHTVASGGCVIYGDSDGDNCPTITPLEVNVDNAGNAYALIDQYEESCDHGAESYTAWLSKRSPSGSLLWNQDVTRAWASAVDAAGNIYTIGDNDSGFNYCDPGDPDHDDDPPYASLVRKYSTNGSLLWERKLPAGVGSPTDIAVTHNGHVFIVGSSGMSRYGPHGSVWWTKPGGAQEVVLSGSSVITRSGLWVRAFDDTGTKRWSTFIGGLTGAYNPDWGSKQLYMDGDSGGNVYVTGHYLASPNNNDAFVRKLNSSGSSQWTRKFSDSAAYETTGIATYNGSEIYITGPSYIDPNPETQASNVYLYKLGSTGNRIWVR